MKKSFIKLFCSIVLISLMLNVTGCVGGKGLSSGTTSQTINSGSVAFNWGGSKYLSSSINSLYISITGEGLTSASTKTVTYSSTTVTFENLPLGTKTAEITALNAIGDTLSKGRVSFTIEAGKTTSASVSLGIVFTDSSFSPASITIPSNTTLLFYNAGNSTHSLVGSSVFGGVSIAPGGSASISFTSNGTYVCYLDSTDSGISGTVVVGATSQWRQVTSPTDKTLESVWVSSSGKVYAAGAPGITGTMVYYNGSSWTTMNPATNNYIWSVNGVSDNDVYAVAATGDTVHYNGGSWSLVSSGAGTLFGVWCASTNDVFAVGTGGIIVYYNGTVWSPMAYPDPADPHALYKAWGTSGSDVFAVGVDGTIIRYNGTAWSTMTSGIEGTNISLWGVWGSSSNDVFAVGAPVLGGAGTILHYNGSTWSTVHSTTQPLYGVWGSSGSDVFAVGDNGTILHYNGTSWSAMTSPATGMLLGVGGNASDNVYCVGDLGTIFRYSN